MHLSNFSERVSRRACRYARASPRPSATGYTRRGLHVCGGGVAADGRGAARPRRSSAFRGRGPMGLGTTPLALHTAGGNGTRETHTESEKERERRQTTERARSNGRAPYLFLHFSEGLRVLSCSKRIFQLLGQRVHRRRRMLAIDEKLAHSQ